MESLDIEGTSHFCEKRTNKQVLDSIKRNITEKDSGNLRIHPLSLSFEQISLLHSPTTNFDKSATLPAGGYSAGGCSALPNDLGSAHFSYFSKSSRLRSRSAQSGFSSSDGGDLTANVCTSQKGNSEGNCGLDKNSVNNENGNFFRPRVKRYDNSEAKPGKRCGSID